LIVAPGESDRNGEEVKSNNRKERVPGAVVVLGDGAFLEPIVRNPVTKTTTTTTASALKANDGRIRP
jgi:hypothetical protein